MIHEYTCGAFMASVKILTLAFSEIRIGRVCKTKRAASSEKGAYGNFKHFCEVHFSFRLL